MPSMATVMVPRSRIWLSRSAEAAVSVVALSAAESAAGAAEEAAELPQPAREAASRADTASRETKRVYFIALHLKNKITGIV